MRTQTLCAAPEDVARAGKILRAGGVVAIPTETVYGLAANALDPAAVKKIFAAKGRPADNPLIVHITRLEQWPPLVEELPPAALALAEAFWPGPLTIILKKSGIIPMETSGGLDTVGVRCPAHPLARAVIEAAGVPLAAPSANRSGEPSPTDFVHTLGGLRGRVDAVLDGGDCPVGVESTVLSLAGDTPRLLRPGGVTVEDLRQVLGRVEVDPAVTAMLAPGRQAASPGMKYKHYAPKAQLIVVDGSPEDYTAWVNGWAGALSAGQRAFAAEALGPRYPLDELPGRVAALCFDETAPELRVPAVAYGPRYGRGEQARRLFSALYRLDEEGADLVFAQRPSPAGVGLAVYNRLLRAAAFRVKRLSGPLVIGLVGPSGAGKSTVGQALARQGFGVIDCDRLTRSEKVYGPACIAQLQVAFGEDIAPGGRLDRRRLAERAFTDASAAKRLGEITFPWIERAVRAEIARLGAQGGPVVLDAPTLFESGLDSVCARILAVTAPEEERLRRIILRDGLTEAQARQRLSAQKPAQFYAERADLAVANGPGAEAAAQAVAAAEEWKKGG